MTLLRPRPRFGARYVDPDSGLRCELHHPKLRPDLWRVCLDGRPDDGEAPSAFGLVLDGDVPMGGLVFRPHSDVTLVEARDAWARGDEVRPHLEHLSLHALRLLDADGVLIAHEGHFSDGDTTLHGDTRRLGDVTATLLIDGVPGSPWSDRIRLLRQWDVMSRSYLAPSSDDVAHYRLWQPIVLDPDDRVDRAIFEVLRDGNEFDVVRTLRPARPTRWVAYPWRRAVLETAPVARRPDRHGHKITPADAARLRDQRVGLADPGLIDLARLIATEGLAGEIRIVDETRSTRTSVPAIDDGIDLAVLAARAVAETDPFLPVRLVAADHVADFLDGLDVVVTTTDALHWLDHARVLGLVAVVVDPGHGHVDILRPDDLADPGFPPTWPALASESASAAAVTATALRHLGLGHEVPSGRVQIGLDEAVGGAGQPSNPPTLVRR